MKNSKFIVKMAIICFVLIIMNLTLMSSRLQDSLDTMTDDFDSLTVECQKLDIRLQAVENEWKRVDDIVKKISILAPKIKESSKLKLAYYIHYYGKQYDNSELLENIMISLPRVESTYNKHALGRAGEVGYYQIHPIHISKADTNIYDEEYQVRKAYEILNRKVSIHSTIEYAVNSYNGWASKNNPYYGKVIVQLEKIKNI